MQLWDQLFDHLCRTLLAYSSSSLGKISLGYSCGDGLSLVRGLLVGHDLQLAPSVHPERIFERRPGHDVLFGVAEVDE